MPFIMACGEGVQKILRRPEPGPVHEEVSPKKPVHDRHLPTRRSQSVEMQLYTEMDVDTIGGHRPIEAYYYQSQPKSVEFKHYK